MKCFCSADEIHKAAKNQDELFNFQELCMSAQDYHL